jgi:hypothetical protein
VPEFPPFMLDMLEVVDFLVESSKCVATLLEVVETKKKNVALGVS